MCQIKPMEVTDVTPYNSQLNDYLQNESRRGRGGFGVRTQIRLDYLRTDGYHVRPEFAGTIDRTYACAILAIDVPCPTPPDQFVPTSVRRRWEADWPKVGRARGDSASHHGWRW